MTDVAFYNLVVHLLHNDMLSEENVALKNIWEQNGNIMLSLYFYRTKTSRVIDSSYIHDIMDITTEKYYRNCQNLLHDFQQYHHDMSMVDSTSLAMDNLDFKHLENLKDDIIILIFVAKCIDYFSAIKKRTIFDYIQKYNSVSNLSAQYIDTYLNGLHPTVADFYQAVDNLKYKTPEAVAELAREVVKIAVSDGVMAYAEKVYIAEILQTLREQGVEPDVGL